jgi:hypothetical protein
MAKNTAKIIRGLAVIISLVKRFSFRRLATKYQSKKKINTPQKSPKAKAI